PFGMANFEELMRIKRRIDGEWAEINRLIERAGRRLRKTLSFDLESASNSFDATAFETNFKTALGKSWPSKWPDGTKSLDQYFARLQELEGHLATNADWLVRLSGIANRAKALKTEDKDWLLMAQLMTEAHREGILAERRATISTDRKTLGDSADSVVGLRRSARFVLDMDLIDGQEEPSWSSLLARLGEYLQPAQLEILDRYHSQLGDPNAAQMLGWSDADRILELAWRQREGLEIQAPELIDWRNAYAHEDARELTVDSGSDTPRWKTFGQLLPDASPDEVPAPLLGTALRSPILAMGSGVRRIDLTLGFEVEGFDLARIEAAVEARALQVEISTEKGWVELDFETYQSGDGKPGADYATLIGGKRDPDEDRPALSLELRADETVDAFAPLKGSGERWPTLRLMLRQYWDNATSGYRAHYQAFSQLHLAALHIKVSVAGLSDLRLRNDERRLDPKKPIEPFTRNPATGSRLYLSHPELVRGRLQSLTLDLDWMGLPDDLVAHYRNYGTPGKLADFKASLELVDQSLALAVLPEAELFDAGPKGQGTATSKTLSVADVPQALATASSTFDYEARLDVGDNGDIRQDPRYFVLELGPGDFGHGDYPVISGRKGRALAAAIARRADLSTDEKLAAYEVNAPYTPKIKQLRAGYVA
ncbi:MAG: hypothetical protein KC431_08325, partial [Myxococcales bacterium]|nr:hypothetical protein [Myxococcales bacterium]